MPAAFNALYVLLVANCLETTPKLSHYNYGSGDIYNVALPTLGVVVSSEAKRATDERTTVLSRINVLSVKAKEVDEREIFMRTLNLRKIRWILREVEKGQLSIYQIAKQQDITPRHCRRIYAKFSEMPENRIQILPCGRSSTPLTQQESYAIEIVRADYPKIGAVSIERLLKDKGMALSHNKIHRFLLSKGWAINEPKKSRTRRWVRYERKTSNSLWHTDWCDFDGKQLIAYLDDASRFITSYGMYDNATTENALKTFNIGVSSCGIPKQLMTDHGSQFCTDENDKYHFRDVITNTGTEHIMSRVKHPQSNGKIERFFLTVRTLFGSFHNIDDVIGYYNFRRPHMSLERDGRLLRPYEAYVLKGGKINEVNLNEQGQYILS